MSVATSSAEVAPLISFAVYCPLLCEDREERAQDNILLFLPRHASLNHQMNFTGFCIAMSSLAARFGVRHSNRQTIRKQRSSVCLCSPVPDLWFSAHVRGGYGDAETTHQLLGLSITLFELLYGRAALQHLTTVPPSSPSPQNAQAPAASSDASAEGNHQDALASAQQDARIALHSFFSKCAAFLSHVLAAQNRRRAATTAAACRPSPSMTAEQWADYLCTEAALGYPLHFVSARELPRLQLGAVEDVVQRVLWPRAWAGAASCSSRTPAKLPRCCVFCLPSLYLLLADSGLTERVVQALKLYLMLYAPIASSSFTCHLPGEGLADVAVWCEGNILVVLVETQPAETASAAGAHTMMTTTTSLLECASAVGAEVRQLLVRCAAGLATSQERERFWLSTCDVAQHDAYYTTAAVSSLAKSATVSSRLPPNTLLVSLRLVGGVVEGTPVIKVWPGLVEHLRTLIRATVLTITASTATESALEYWPRWGSIWIFLRFAGATVTVLAWRSPVNMRQLYLDAKRTLLVCS